MSRTILILCLLALLVGLGNTEAVVVGEWLFNNQNNPGLDTSGNGNNGILNGGAKWVADGYMGGSIDFNGIDSFIEVPDAEILAPLEEATVCIWVYPRSYNLDYIGVFGKGGVHMDFDILLFKSDEKVHWYVSGVVDNYDVTSQETVPLNEWTHLAVTYESEDKIEIYINGKFSAETAIAEQRNPSPEPVLMGKSFWENRWFDGKLDEVYLLDEALGEEGIQKFMEGDVSPVEPNGKVSTVWGDIKKLN